MSHVAQFMSFYPLVNISWSSSYPLINSITIPKIIIVVKLWTVKFYELLRSTEAALQRCSCKKVFWKYAASIQENTHPEMWFQQSCKTTLLKSHFGMGALPYIHWIFSEHLFLRTSAKVYFWIYIPALVNCKYLIILETRMSDSSYY